MRDRPRLSLRGAAPLILLTTRWGGQRRAGPAGLARHTAQSGMELDGRAGGFAVVSDHAFVSADGGWRLGRRV